jgi:hypothetical protein
MRLLSASFSLLIGLALMPRPATAADRPADLGMAQLRQLTIDRTSDGRRLLRFTATILNVGFGPFELHGQRPDTLNPDMTVSQRIFDDAGGSRNIPTTAVMYYAGDGHNHWHVRDLARYELVRLDNGVKVGTGAKRGFCFFDNYRSTTGLPGAPQSPVYVSCGTNPAALAVTMGLSIGWGDTYNYTLSGQYIDITALAAGRYRLLATADADNWFVEGSETNNATWVDIQLRGHGAVKILAYGPYY